MTGEPSQRRRSVGLPRGSLAQLVERLAVNQEVAHVRSVQEPPMFMPVGWIPATTMKARPLRRE